MYLKRAFSYSKQEPGSSDIFSHFIDLVGQKKCGWSVVGASITMVTIESSSKCINTLFNTHLFLKMKGLFQENFEVGIQRKFSKSQLKPH